MAGIYDFDSYRGDRSPQKEPPRSHNQEILAQLQALFKASDTPEARLVSELRGVEEVLLANHRRYAELWAAADRLGITSPVRTASQIVRDADVLQGLPPLPPELTPYSDAPEAVSQLLTDVCLPLLNIRDPDPPPAALGHDTESPAAERLPTPGEIIADTSRFFSPEQSDGQNCGREDDGGMGR